MSGQTRDLGLGTLLDLDGQVLVVDPAGRYWVRFVVQQVPPSSERPHGLSYSLTLHDPNGERLVGFDNQHPVRPTKGPSGRGAASRDHKHRYATVRPYGYADAATLLSDFWAEVDAVLRERGVMP